MSRVSDDLLGVDILGQVDQLRLRAVKQQQAQHAPQRHQDNVLQILMLLHSPLQSLK